MNIKRSIESLLFVSPKPLSLKELADVLEIKTEDVEREIGELINDYKNGNRGILIIENSKKYQMSSSPESAEVVQKFMQSEVSGELTPASLETLTIIAYRGPIKKKDIEKIRGINCSLILKNLLIRGLIEEKQGNEIEDNIYTVSLDFVKFLGISSLNELPDYEKFNKNEEIDKLLGDINKSEDKNLNDLISENVENGFEGKEEKNENIDGDTENEEENNNETDNEENEDLEGDNEEDEEDEYEDDENDEDDEDDEGDSEDEDEELKKE
ncbi:MAG TPA: SMC-Scp complex subunit ScpB [bacterium]|nr:SMC-Scp complex subunit ScpB [bacterium]HPV65298.1 SMC-Scp complex subunit ScpB [bacterium]